MHKLQPHRATAPKNICVVFFRIKIRVKMVVKDLTWYRLFWFELYWVVWPDCQNLSYTLILILKKIRLRICGLWKLTVVSCEIEVKWWFSFSKHKAHCVEWYSSSVFFFFFLYGQLLHTSSRYWDNTSMSSQTYFLSMSYTQLLQHTRSHSTRCCPAVIIGLWQTQFSHTHACSSTLVTDASVVSILTTHP